MTQPSTQSVLTVRLQPDEYEALRAIADRNRRSLSQQVRRWIEEARETGQEAA